MLEQRRDRLKAVLNDADNSVRQAAATALERLEPELPEGDAVAALGVALHAALVRLPVLYALGR